MSRKDDKIYIYSLVLKLSFQMKITILVFRMAERYFYFVIEKTGHVSFSFQIIISNQSTKWK